MVLSSVYFFTTTTLAESGGGGLEAKTSSALSTHFPFFPSTVWTWKIERLAEALWVRLVSL